MTVFKNSAFFFFYPDTLIQWLSELCNYIKCPCNQEPDHTRPSETRPMFHPYHWPFPPSKNNHYSDFSSSYFFLFLYSFVTPVYIPERCNLVLPKVSRIFFKGPCTGGVSPALPPVSSVCTVATIQHLPLSSWIFLQTGRQIQIFDQISILSVPQSYML